MITICFIIALIIETIVGVILVHCWGKLLKERKVSKEFWNAALIMVVITLTISCVVITTISNMIIIL